ncbi:PREDICTED: acyl-CoA-binding domain-containing protein 4-like [Tarenaya hassleriana]|uniref:acyl-CoA-binding domain-containing protein 4-like n=1 Tax=Tarenaya hassleriana TaxID=28532 RepID=UPI00053C2FB1|nr:PREDICTED: acyl-CoA-binding domain-containing protein 4-like [Tarenaya hassleriana]
MGSFGDETTTKKKATWVYPKVLGHNPRERWGHSACYSNGLLYIFGGCCGGLHFSEVITLNLRTMTWTAFATTGRRPGPRDSHTAVLVRNKMIVFGGTNGSHKVNDLHVLDLVSREWSTPNYLGTPPSPRESHTATVVGEDKMVIFGGSGEGEGNYLNDLHVLDLGTMTWTCPEGVRGDWPVPRDSHSSVAVAKKLIVYGGDSGDRYHGDVDVFDMDTLTWSRLLVDGSSPGARAGHASLTIGSKVYIIGGVGDKHYYNDVWVLDMSGNCSWTCLNVGGQKPQGRFSHAAVSTTGSDITIYGGCGEDERPLNELLVLKLEKDEHNDPHNISTRKLFNTNHWSKDHRRYLRDRGEDIRELQSFGFNSDMHHKKRRRMSNSKVCNIESDQEGRSLSLLSKHSAPLRCERDYIPIQRHQETSVRVPSFNIWKQFRRSHNNNLTSLRQSQEHCPMQNVQHIPTFCKASDSKTSKDLIGANVVGKVDGTFDSGLLMTAVVDGKIFRGILFSPGSGIGPQLPFTSPIVVAQAAAKPLNSSSSPAANPRRSDLEGVVLTLGGPGDMHMNE